MLRHCITSVAGKATVAPPFRRLRSASGAGYRP